MRVPLCEHCKARGLLVVATQVDHRLPIEQGGHPTDSRNLQSLCESCHSVKTGQDKGSSAQVRTTFDVDGCPIDSDHHWNQT